MKALSILTLLVVLFIPKPSFAQQESGGGDQCEQDFKKHHKTVMEWIPRIKVGELDLPKGIDHHQYQAEMLKWIDPTLFSITCLSEKNFENKNRVSINGVPKTCIWEKNGTQLNFFCNFERFNSLSRLKQIRQVNHEFSSLFAEKPYANGESNYFVSDQTEDFYIENNITWELLAYKRTTLLKTEGICNISIDISYNPDKLSHKIWTEISKKAKAQLRSKSHLWDSEVKNASLSLEKCRAKAEKSFYSIDYATPIKSNFSLNKIVWEHKTNTVTTKGNFLGKRRFGKDVCRGEITQKTFECQSNCKEYTNKEHFKIKSSPEFCMGYLDSAILNQSSSARIHFKGNYEDIWISTPN